MKTATIQLFNFNELPEDVQAAELQKVYEDYMGTYDVVEDCWEVIDLIKRKSGWEFDINKDMNYSIAEYHGQVKLTNAHKKCYQLVYDGDCVMFNCFFPRNFEKAQASLQKQIDKLEEDIADYMISTYRSQCSDDEFYKELAEDNMYALLDGNYTLLSDRFTHEYAIHHE